MDTLLLKLRKVPDDEAGDIRNLLSAHHIAFRETPENQFGMALPAIWIRDPGQVAHARQLLREYRDHRARQTLMTARMRGPADTRVRDLRAHPLVIALFVIAGTGLVYLALRPLF